ncbi:hypothetical protein BH10PAT3_BH10PAT3_7290 [soil metagenome]
MKHRKLILFGAVVVFLIGGFYIYKYSYIYVERRKYDKATVAINKVADDLRAQGINTEFSRGCSNNIELQGLGSVSCAVIITMSDDNTEQEQHSLLKKYLTVLKENRFDLTKRGSMSLSTEPVLSGISGYANNNLDLDCTMQYINNKLSHIIIFKCGGPSHFKLY